VIPRPATGHGRGRPPAARKALAQAAQWPKAPSKRDSGQTNATGLAWDERLEVGVLRREEALIGPPQP
jgi:hypothetical protein